MDAPLHADFGGTTLPGLLGSTRDLRQIEIVGRAPQVLAQLPLREGAELALEVAHVRVVDVAVDHVGHVVAADLAAECVGRSHHGHQVISARSEEGRNLRLPQPVPLERLLHQRLHLGRGGGGFVPIEACQVLLR